MTPPAPAATPMAPIKAGLRAYKRRYYLSRLVRGVLLGVGGLVTGYLAVALLEYLGRFGPGVRTGLFYVALTAGVYVLARYILWPLWQLILGERYLSDAEAARQIGAFFPDVADKLLNLLELGQGEATALAQAAIAQKARALSVIPFEKAAPLEGTQRYLPWALLPLAVLAGLALTLPQVLSDPTERLLRHRREFIPEAPFAFRLLTDTLEGYVGEPLTLRLALQGPGALPSLAEIERTPDQVMAAATTAPMPEPMQTMGPGTFTYTLRPTGPGAQTVRFLAAGFRSEGYTVQIHERPRLESLTMQLRPPAYTGRPTETLEGSGTATAPAGSEIVWQIEAAHAQQIRMIGLGPLAGRVITTAGPGPEGRYRMGHRLIRTLEYRIELIGRGRQADTLRYTIEALEDAPPAVELALAQDSARPQYVTLAGAATDDYGLTRLEARYRMAPASEGQAALDKATWRTRPIALQSGGGRAQTYLQQLDLDALGVGPGMALEFETRAYDNDGIQGPKAGTSRRLRLRLDSPDEAARRQQQLAQQTMQGLSEAVKESRTLQKELAAARQRMIGQRQMSHQDRRAVEQLLDRQQQLDEQVQRLQKEGKRAIEQDRRQEAREEIQQKAAQLQQLMDELLDEKTRELYRQLQQLMDERTPPERTRELLEQMAQKEQTLSEELSRTLELFKKLNVERKAEQTIKTLEQIAQEQKELADKIAAQEKQEKGPRDQRPTPADRERLANQQRELSKKFDQARQDMRELEKMNAQLEDPAALPDSQKLEERIAQGMDKAADQQQSGQSGKAGQSGQQAAEDTQALAKQLEEATQEAQEREQAENARDLRMILENLLRLSFDQEEVMGQMGRVSQLDPKYLELSSRQIKLQGDAALIQDSLRALARRVFQIQSFVTREVTDMNLAMTQSVEALRQRQPGQAAGRGQLALTSMNNLALMLNDALRQMEQQMRQQAQSKPGKGQGKPGKSKPGQGPPKPGKGKPGQGQGQSPSLSDMQKQLNEQIGQLQRSGKQGRELSEEIAQMAARQQAIRRALQELERTHKPGGNRPGQQGQQGQQGQSGQQAGGQGGQQAGKGQDAQRQGGNQPGAEGTPGGAGDPAAIRAKMEQTERELVGKKITPQTLERQREIMTRLLEAEKSLRERGEDEQREARTAQALPPPVPPSLQEYLRARERQVEQLKATPLPLTPYYRAQNDRYFRQLPQR